MSKVEETRLTIPQLARTIGVTKQRIHRVKDEKRIVGLAYSLNGRATVPVNPRILRGQRERPGPLTEYITTWESVHGIPAEDNTVEAFHKNGHSEA